MTKEPTTYDPAFDTAVCNAWEQWPIIKDQVIDFGFRDWCKRVGGFGYTMSNDGPNRRTRLAAVLVEIYDEQKFAWFMLKWS